MMMMSQARNHEAGSGERLEARQERQARLVKGSLFAVGVISGAAIGFHVATSGFDLSGGWPPALSAGIAVLYLLAMLFGSIALSRVTDEVERARSYKATALAGAVYLVIYPVWFLLWKGGFVVEPIHWLLFAIFWLSLAAGTLHYRIR